MNVSILIDEKQGFEKAAALAGLSVDFYTQENNDRILTMVVSECSHEMIFHFTRMAETQNEILRFVNGEEKRK